MDVRSGMAPTGDGNGGYRSGWRGPGVKRTVAEFLRLDVRRLHIAPFVRLGPELMSAVEILNQAQDEPFIARLAALIFLR